MSKLRQNAGGGRLAETLRTRLDVNPRVSLSLTDLLC